MSEPTTEAGRALNMWRVPIRADQDWRTFTDAILAIEREAAEKALHSAAERLSPLADQWEQDRGLTRDEAVADLRHALAAILQGASE